ncbi:MAG: hypothetical protein Q8O64_09965 [Sideroxyarcus sp.]|nr:hypothetical protein [Sideroxyarcus sp.]
MSKQQCYNCGVVDSIHEKDSATSKLVAGMGPKGEDGLIIFLVYCRSCHAVNIYKPGWFGSIKYSGQSMDAEKMARLIEQGQLKKDAMGIFPRHLQKAMLEDGVLPKNWELI